MNSIIALLEIVVIELPGAIKTAEELYALGEKFFASINGRKPTAVEIAELRASIDADVAEALTPMPPE